MKDYTEYRTALEAIEDEQEQDSFIGIQLVFYLNPLFGKRHRTRACFDLMDFEDEEFFEKREKKPEKN